MGGYGFFSNITVGATVAVGFAYYLKFFVPSMPTNIGAAIAVILATFIHLAGMKETSKINNLLVIIKILILLFL